MSTVLVTVIGPGGSAKDLRLTATSPIKSLIEGIASELGVSPSAGCSLRSETGDELSFESNLRSFEGHRLILHQDAIVNQRGRFGRRPKARIEPVKPMAGYRVFPCYLAIDISSSMYGQPIDDINGEVPRLYAKMRREPQLAEICQLSVITFDSTARTVVPLTDIDSVQLPSVLEAVVPHTNFADVFSLLRECISSDLYDLFDRGRRPYVPAVFFLSDGQPNSGSWVDQFKALASHENFYGAPNLIAFGFGEAEEEVIRFIGQRAAYLQEEGTPAAKLDEFMTFLLTSLTKSIKLNAAKDENDIFEVPSTPPPGWRSLKTHV